MKKRMLKRDIQAILRSCETEWVPAWKVVTQERAPFLALKRAGWVEWEGKTAAEITHRASTPAEQAAFERACKVRYKVGTAVVATGFAMTDEPCEKGIHCYREEAKARELILIYSCELERLMVVEIIQLAVPAQFLSSVGYSTRETRKERVPCCWVLT